MSTLLFNIDPAENDDVPQIKRLIAANNGPQDALGFIPTTVWYDAVEDGNELWVAKNSETGLVYGMLHGSHHKRDLDSYLGTLCVGAPYRRHRVAWALVNHFVEVCHSLRRNRVLVHCVLGAPANKFWEAYGFRFVEIKAGRKRDQNVWEFPL